jgi:formamidopyrimidine-DNA glycosylase
VPELPEVETVRVGLASHALNREIADVEVLRDRAVRRHPGGAADLQARLRGAVLASAVRRGKYLWLTLADGADGAHGAGEALLVHLGMSGQLLVRGAAVAPPAGGGAAPQVGPGPVLADAAGAGPVPAVLSHVRVRLRFVDGGQLWFVDQRTFGHLLLAPLVPTADGAPGGLGSAAPTLPAPISHIARDLLDPVLAPDGPARASLVDRIRSRRTGLKRALLDQSLVSGVGNIYADEGLWRAGEHYDQPTSGLSRPRVRAVLDRVSAVMTEALAAGGTSFDALYVNVNGASGYFDRSLAVYGQAGRPCRRCAAVVIREPFMNRSSFRCPRCQPQPRVAR